MAEKKEKVVYNANDNTFVYEEKKYKVLIPAVIIPGVNKHKPVTAAEVAASKDIQAYLVDEAKAFGTVIEEIIEAPAAAEETK